MKIATTAILLSITVELVFVAVSYYSNVNFPVRYGTVPCCTGTVLLGLMAASLSLLSCQENIRRLYFVCISGVRILFVYITHYILNTRISTARHVQSNVRSQGQNYFEFVL
jgi:hypothetical protein